MKDQRKKLVAAVTAVNAYLEAESAEQRARRDERPRGIPAPWGRSARQEMMQNRIAMQRKTFR